MAIQDNTVFLSQATFAALLHRTLETCYPDIRERCWMLGRSAKYLFGYDVTNHDIGYSISGRMNQSSKLAGVVSGKKLYEFCIDYDKTGTNSKITLTPSYFKYLLHFTGLDEIHLAEHTRYLCETYPKTFPPRTIGQLYLCYPLASSPISTMSEARPLATPVFSENLIFFVRSKWYFYFYEYESIKPQLIRQVLTFKQTGDNYFATISNTSIKYATYTGNVIEMTNRRLRIELKGEEGKIMNLMVHMDPSGESELYMGMFLKNASGLLSCSVILHRIPDSVTQPKADTFLYDEPAITQLVPKSIRDFFEQKKLVYTKVPKCYSIKELDVWLEKKRRERQEDIANPVFLAAPVGSSETYKKEIFDFQDSVVEKFSTKVYFGPRNQEYYFRSLKNNLQTEWRELCHSRVLLMVVPAAPVFSSCWVILGWAMAREMPIFLLCDGDNGIPNMVKYADIHPKVEKINISGLKHFPDGAVEALSNNTLWREIICD